MHPLIKQVGRIAKPYVYGARRLAETILFGGSVRERVLVGMLGALYRSQFRREWVYNTGEPPHFYYQRWNGFRFVYGDGERNPYCFNRGFLALEMIRNGDRLLDIGCGDGFFTNTFFSTRCSAIDAVDIERSAIETAKRFNASDKIRYRLLDAVNEPFPGNEYDVIVWDGAIGHFAAGDLASVLGKIVSTLAPGGVFAGSESLGTEGSDHLQFFHTAGDLAEVLKPYFKRVMVRVVEYRIGDGRMRREAYWRCTQGDSDRIESGRSEEFGWTDWSGNDQYGSAAGRKDRPRKIRAMTWAPMVS
jgi:SAM-dependent methyltransferase